MYQCPKCQGKLIVVMADENRLDKCTQCGGLWFDKGELQELLEKKVYPRADGEENKNYQALNNLSGKCPLCDDVDLVQVSVSELTIETCPSCNGIWLEEGEYTKILEKNLWEELKNYLS